MLPTLCPVGCLSVAFQNETTGLRLSNVRTQQTKNWIGQILFLYLEERLVSSNLNSKQLRLHGVRPTVNILHEWFRVKNILCVSCAAWNVFPLNLLISSGWTEYQIHSFFATATLIFKYVMSLTYEIFRSGETLSRLHTVSYD